MMAVLAQKEDFWMALISVTMKFCSSSGIGVAGVAVLVAGSLEEADGGQVAGGERGGEVQGVVLVVGGAGPVSAGADGGDRGGTGVVRVRGAGVVLEGLVVLDVVGLGDAVTAEVVVRSQPVVPLELVTPRLNPPWNQPQVTPAALSRSPMFLPDMLNAGGGGGADVAGRVGIADEGVAAVAVGDDVGGSCRCCVVDDAVGLAGDRG